MSMQESQSAIPCLPADVKVVVLAFLDVPTLSRCALASKELSKAAKSDKVWEPHLKLLLEELYDNCRKHIRVEDHDAVPLFKRPLKSTEVAGWFEDYRIHLLKSNQALPYRYVVEMPLIDTIMSHFYTNKEETRCRQFEAKYKWFWKDVPLCEYYHQAATWAIRAEFQYFTYELETEGKCQACLDMRLDDDCVCGYYLAARFQEELQNQTLRKLPSIRLFQTFPCIQIER